VGVGERGARPYPRTSLLTLSRHKYATEKPENCAVCEWGDVRRVTEEKERTYIEGKRKEGKPKRARDGCGVFAARHLTHTLGYLVSPRRVVHLRYRCWVMDMRVC